MSKMETPNPPQYTPHIPISLSNFFVCGFDLNHQEPKPQPKTDCYFHKECQDGPWCKYRHCADPKCEGCHAYVTNEQVDKLIRKLVDNG